jgi:hypothetical protein
MVCLSGTCPHIQISHRNISLPPRGYRNGEYALLSQITSPPAVCDLPWYPIKFLTTWTRGEKERAAIEELQLS